MPVNFLHRFVPTENSPMTRTLIQKPIIRHILVAVVITGTASSALYAHAATAQDSDHILISDQFNNRVIEVDRQTHRVVWHFGNGSDLPGPHSVVGVNDAERFGPLTLISGTGTPPGSPGCSDTVNGCPDNRVFIVDPGGNILWQYGYAGVTGDGPNQLNTPVQSLFLVSFPQHLGPHVLITDQGNQRIILVNLNHQIEWQYGTTGVSGDGPNQLNSPNSAEVLENGHILIADENNNRVIEVKPDLQIVKEFTAQGTVSGAAFASRLPNGDTLISDSNNNRIVEVNGNDQVVWQYFTNTQPGSNPNPLPTRGVRLQNGDTLISDQFNERVIEVTKVGKIVFDQGQLNAPGDGFNELNGPYDAKQIGDFTGLTPPFGF
jgi:outer membrane protein assembly factor BamB